jgi:hypothetical protein
MDCRNFRETHAEFVDARCTSLQEDAMREHMANCRECARHDMLVRRSLLLVRNLPTIEPSPDFQARLEARLLAASLTPIDRRRFMRPSFAMFTTLAAAIASVTFAASALTRRAVRAEIRLAPVVASLPEVDAATSPVASPALVATMPTGMTVWPAIMVATQAPMHFVAAELASER